jgi:nitrate reductase assembly molybdenum cofactor insertion protein NarJ
VSLQEDPTAMPFAHWMALLRNMTPLEVGERWSAAFEGREPGYDNTHFHMAVIDRLYQIALIAPAITPEQRMTTLGFAERVLAAAAERFARHPDVVAQMREALAETRKHYEAFATDVARQFLFETGQINQWGGFFT